MPIIAPSQGTTPSTPSTPVEIPEIGYASITYYDPTGTAWPLTSPDVGWFTLADSVSGMGAAPYTLTTDPHPRGGSRLRHVQVQSRTIVWPLMIQGADHTEFVSRWRALARAFTRTLREGPGTLEVARPDGTRRQIDVHYQEGFDGLGNAQSGITWDSAVLSLYCEDPYWVDPVPRTVTREYGTGEDYLVPFPSVSSGQVLGATTVDNPGDIEVWPEWTISGPASLVTFTHTGKGESFVLNPSATGVAHGNLLAGQSVTVNTDPARVRYQDGTNWIATLNWPGAQLFSLSPGSNSVTFQLDGSAAGSSVSMTFHPRYETA